MAELQNQVKSCICEADDFLASSSKCNRDEFENFMKNTYRVFLHRAWYELPVNNADGSALATVSCMSLWELLSEYTSTCHPSSVSKKGFAVQALTAMYSKSKDRRCIFQQLNCCGNSPQTAVPLNTHIPLELYTPEVPESDSHREYIKAVRQITKIARLGSYLDGKESPAISALFRHFMAALLPKCTLVDVAHGRSNSNSNTIPILFRDSGEAWNSGFYFLHTLWCFLVVGEYLGLKESKELAAYLRSSRWASQFMSIGGQRCTYAKILTPLTDISALCMALNLNVPSTSVDTIPLVDPRVVQLLCNDGCKAPVPCPAKSFSEISQPKRMVESKTSLTAKRLEQVGEQLGESIPNEIEFMGFSSSCRDFDQLAYLCRDLLFSPSTENVQAKENWMSKRRDLLFNRKRRRGGSNIDGPCFIPVKSSLSHVMEKSSAESMVVLERLCTKWKEE